MRGGKIAANERSNSAERQGRAAGAGAPLAEGPASRSEGPGGGPGPARGRAPANRRGASPRRSADRAPAPHPGPLRPPLRCASRGARQGNAPLADRGLRGRDLLPSLRRGEGGRGPSAGIDSEGLRFAVLRAGWCGETSQGTFFGRKRESDPRTVRRTLRVCTGGGGRPESGPECHAFVGEGRGGGKAGKVPRDQIHRLRRLSQEWWIFLDKELPRGQAHAR